MWLSPECILWEEPEGCWVMNWQIRWLVRLTRCQFLLLWLTWSCTLWGISPSLVAWPSLVRPGQVQVQMWCRTSELVSSIRKMGQLISGIMLTIQVSFLKEQRQVSKRFFHPSYTSRGVGVLCSITCWSCTTNYNPFKYRSIALRYLNAGHTL